MQRSDARSPRSGRPAFPATVRRLRRVPPMEFEIGIGKTARRAYGFDEVAIVPSRRTRDPEDVDIALGDRRVHVRAADDGERDGRRRLAGHRRSRSAASAASRASTSRGCGPATRTRSRSTTRSPNSARREGHPPDAGAVRRADQGGADRPADRGDQGGRRRPLRLAHARSGSSSTRSSCWRPGSTSW